MYGGILHLIRVLQAMALVNDRLNAAKPQTPEVKGGKLPPGAVNNNKDLDVDVKKEEPSFFGSFFSSAKSTGPKKKGVQVMENVSSATEVVV